MLLLCASRALLLALLGLGGRAVARDAAVLDRAPRVNPGAVLELVPRQGSSGAVPELVPRQASSGAVPDLAPRQVNPGAVPDLASRQGTPGSGVIHDFQVHEPVLTPEGPRDAYGCVHTQTLMVHEFANSYGQPFVGPYTPPPCSFNRVTMNFTATSQGRQFDRLAIMYLGDTEVWRTSTAEPTTAGIVWSYVKEMQQYNALWRTAQTLIFDLGNLVDSTYTGPYNTTLTATFFTVPDSPPTADRILPISKRLGSSGGASVFTIPSDNASVAYTLPRTVARAVVSVSACGQIGEEFWYTNVFNNDVGTFNASEPLPGGGPWREVQVLIDGRLAGVSWPFPVIFTGGVVPGLWRPIVGIDTFDLREHEIDVTPWLGVLLDGTAHQFEIRVASVGAPDGHGGAAVADLPTSYWLVTGKVFLFLGNTTTKATKPTVAISGPALRVGRTLTKQGTLNDTLLETTSATRDIAISATVNGQPVSWTQHLRYTNRNFLAGNATIQNTTQSTTGSDATRGGYFSAYAYPIRVNQTYALAPDQSLTRIDATLAYGLQLSVLGPAVFPSGVQPFNRSALAAAPAPAAPHPLFIPSTAPQSPIALPALPPFTGAVLNTTLSGAATYLVTTDGTSSASFSFGTTNQTLRFAGTEAGEGVTELYRRDVSAVNTTVVRDRSVLLGIVSPGVTGRPAVLGFGEGRAQGVLSAGEREAQGGGKEG